MRKYAILVINGDCYALNTKSKQPTGQGKGACVAASVPTVSAVKDKRGKGQCDALTNRLEPFFPFVSEGFVSLGETEEKVPVKILRYTAAFDSFIHISFAIFY